MEKKCRLKKYVVRYKERRIFVSNRRNETDNSEKTVCELSLEAMSSREKRKSKNHYEHIYNIYNIIPIEIDLQKKLHMKW